MLKNDFLYAFIQKMGVTEENKSSDFSTKPIEMVVGVNPVIRYNMNVFNIEITILSMMFLGILAWFADFLIIIKILLMVYGILIFIMIEHNFQTLLIDGDIILLLRDFKKMLCIGVISNLLGIECLWTLASIVVIIRSRAIIIRELFNFSNLQEWLLLMFIMISCIVVMVIYF